MTSAESARILVGVRPSDAYELLATALELDAAAHESGRVADIGASYDTTADAVEELGDPDLNVIEGFHFWERWIDARNHNWFNYPGTTFDDWPVFARRMASALRRGHRPEDVPDALLTIDEPWNGVSWIRRVLGLPRRPP